MIEGGLLQWWLIDGLSIAGIVSFLWWLVTREAPKGEVETFIVEVDDSSVASPTPNDHQGSIMTLPNGTMIDVLEVIDKTHVRGRVMV